MTKDFVLPIAQMQIEKNNNLCLVYLSLTAILRELPVCALSNMSRKELFCQEKRLKLRQQQGGFLERPS